ncbi:MAG: hypothetical protein AB8C46_00335, partial [Burkholderiaceae bacterium]
SLAHALNQRSPLVVAVSGGVDSLTLAWSAATLLGPSVRVVHAAGPAVPPLATERVKAYARRWGWDLQVLNAGEYQDPEYRKNPVNRCYYCKSNLYQRIRESCDTPAFVAAGTNLDDLGEYRPGLLAADEQQVIHPFVDAAMAKSAVRELAAAAGLDDIAQLPAQPCLASRVETGISIKAEDLTFIDQIEQLSATRLNVGDIRCRVTRQGVWLEADPGVNERAALIAHVRQACEESGRVFAGIRPYRRGSAFLTTAADEQVIRLRRNSQSKSDNPVSQIRRSTS